MSFSIKISTVIAAGMIAGLSACAPEKPPLNLSPEALAAVQQKWQGTWAGGWGTGTCKSRIEVSDVTGNSAYVLYHYQNCGGTGNGSLVDYSADIDGDVLTADVGNATATYRLTDTGTLDGTFVFDSNPGRVIRGSFTRQ